MAQSTKNFIRIFIIPFALGFLLRIMIRKNHNAHRLTAGSIVLAVFLWIFAYLIPNYGSELYGIIAWIGTMFASGTSVAGIVCRGIKGD